MGLVTAIGFSNLVITGLRDERLNTGPHVVLGSLGFIANVIASFGLISSLVPGRRMTILIAICAAITFTIALTFGPSVTTLRYLLPSLLYVATIWPQLVRVLEGSEDRA